MDRVMGVLPYCLLYMYVLFTNIRMGKRIKILSDPRLIFFLIFLFAALRGNGNGDYFKYYDNVSLVTSWENVVSPVSFPFEIGFRFLAFVTNVLNLDPQFAIAAMNAISIGSIYYVLKRYSKDIYLSILLFIPFLLQYDMHHSRSAVAMSLTLMMFIKIYEGKYIPALVSALLAVSFHKASILPIAIVCIWTIIRKKNLKLKYITYRTVFITIFLLYIIVQFVNPYQVVLGVLNILGLNGMHFKLSSYLSNERWSYSFSLLDPRFILLLFTYLGGYLAQRVSTSKDELFVLLNDMILLGVVSIIVLSNSTIVTMRIYNYFNLFSIVQIPYALHYLRNQNISIDYPHAMGRSIRMRMLFTKEIIMFVYVIYTLALIFKQVPYYFVFA